jgi:hypothetical protein
MDRSTQAADWIEAWVYAQADAQADAQTDEVSRVRAIDLETKRTLEFTAIELAALEPIARSIMANIRAGHWEATPSDRACVRCPYAEICPDRYLF